jgi:hypothetical protein
MHKSSRILVIAIVLLIGSSVVLGSDCDNGGGYDPGPVTPEVPTPEEPPIEEGGIPTDTIEAGDTLAAIADEHGVSVDDLLAVNNLTDPDQIQVGQKLLIPVP